MYFSGKAEPEVYREHPFDYKVLRQDIDKYMDADEEIIKLQDALINIDLFEVERRTLQQSISDSEIAPDV